MMSRAEIYEKNAAECERESARAPSSALKSKYRGLAQQWREMAEQAIGGDEAKKSRKGSERELTARRRRNPSGP
jgi:hypothetical protein